MTGVRRCSSSSSPVGAPDPRRFLVRRHRRRGQCATTTLNTPETEWMSRGRCARRNSQRSPARISPAARRIRDDLPHGATHGFGRAAHAVTVNSRRISGSAEAAASGADRRRKPDYSPANILAMRGEWHYFGRQAVCRGRYAMRGSFGPCRPGLRSALGPGMAASALTPSTAYTGSCGSFAMGWRPWWWR